jgi:hypothetical protein
MMKLAFIPVVMLTLISIAASCNRNSGGSDEALETGAALRNMAKISADDPFEGQPNEFCTVIRKLPASDIGSTSDQYCLLDVCLDDDETTILSIDLGDGEEQIMAAYKLIKVFQSAEEAQQYALKYRIVDVVISN